MADFPKGKDVIMTRSSSSLGSPENAAKAKPFAFSERKHSSSALGRRSHRLLSGNSTEHRRGSEKDTPGGFSAGDTTQSGRRPEESDTLPGGLPG